MYSYSYDGRNYNTSRPIPSSYDFESLIDNEKNLLWMKEHWHYSIYLSVAYLISIFVLQNYMRSRPPFEFRRWMALWNGTLAFYSILCTLRGMEVIEAASSEFGLHFIICDGVLLRYMPRITFWGWIFIYSKAFELGDTVFVVLSKGKLLFLHCYHHAATLVLAWYMTAREVSALAVMGYLNAIVHSFMYTYFAFKAFGYKIPRSIAMTITVLQTTQMAIGVLVSIYAYWLVRKGESCDSPADALEYAFCIYLSYAILFCHLFYTSYVKSSVSPKKNV